MCKKVLFQKVKNKLSIILTNWKFAPYTYIAQPCSFFSSNIKKQPFRFCIIIIEGFHWAKRVTCKDKFDINLPNTGKKKYCRKKSKIIYVTGPHTIHRSMDLGSKLSNVWIGLKNELLLLAQQEPQQKQGKTKAREQTSRLREHLQNCKKPSNPVK